ncbi:MAG: LolA-like outer membrane lipoprotein chaperone [Campylobacterota bacterium]|nr:LolA-like outer membrane lipoprotein chaperone [Campylobacterota bacterium]
MINSIRYTLFFLCSALLFAQGEVKLPMGFHASFVQTITNDQKKKIIYRGKIDFSSPENFKWHYTSPTKKEVCTDGTELLVVDHDLEQVSYYVMDGELDLPAILKESKLHRKSVYIATHRGKNYTIQVNKRGELSRIAYMDNLDNTVLIVFSNMKYRKKRFSTNRMKCHTPKNYDYIGG